MNIVRPYNLTIKMNYYMIVLLILSFLGGYLIEGLTITIIIILHELAHLFVASLYGIKAKEIELFPFGGVAKLDGIIGPDPREEIHICLAGPLLNLIIFLILLLIRNIGLEVNILNFLYKINFLMLLINILPIFPLDGGKILRAILSYFLGFKKSTIIMTQITYVISTVVIIFGLAWSFYDIQNLYIVILAVFTVLAARNERNMAAFIFIRNIAFKKKHFVKSRVMKTHLFVCLKSVTGKEILDYFLPNKYHIIIVIDYDGGCRGTITEYELINGLLTYGIDVTLENLLINTKKW